MPGPSVGSKLFLSGPNVLDWTENNISLHKFAFWLRLKSLGLAKKKFGPAESPIHCFNL